MIPRQKQILEVATRLLCAKANRENITEYYGSDSSNLNSIILIAKNLVRKIEELEQ